MTGDLGFAEFWRSLNAPCYVVYKMYDGAGNLLYVGYTGNLRRRMWQHYHDKPWVREQVERVEVEPGLTYDEARTMEAELIEEHEPPQNKLWPYPPEEEPLPHIPNAVKDGKWWLLPTNVTMSCDGCDDPLSGRHAVRFLRYGSGGTYVGGLEGRYIPSEYWEMRGRCPTCGTVTVREMDNMALRNAIGFEPPPYRWRAQR